MKTKPKIKLDETMKDYALRLPAYLKLWLEANAKPQKRSLNSEIILILEKYYAANDKN